MLSKLVRNFFPSGIFSCKVKSLTFPNLKEESENFASDVSFSAFFVVDDTGRGGENDVSALSGWEQVVLPFFHVSDGDVVSWGDDTAFVDSSVQVDDDFAGSVVIDFFEFSDVTVLLHDSEELDDDLGA